MMSERLVELQKQLDEAVRRRDSKAARLIAIELRTMYESRWMGLR
jgi:hypothetical protein